ncbi:MAG: hypothetical protein IPI07_02350 [Flavobacteriales bacterium]|nr:hypothetical protein [Flavobacteriales bacterium]
MAYTTTPEGTRGPGVPAAPKAQDRTVLYVVLGIVVVAAIIWATMAGNDNDANGRDSARNTEQVDRIPASTP